MTEYFRFVIRNIEPVRISNDSISQNGQTVSLRYIPGSSIRGYVINKIADRQDFEAVKKILFSDKVRFLNAYLYADEKELIPSLKGFYEDKKNASGKKEIKNILVEEFGDGLKRAALGRFCYVSGDTINYYNVDTNSDMKIKINDKDNNVFRNEYMEAGNEFVGYIAIDDESVKDIISGAFEDIILIGNARSQGLGKCRVNKKEFSSKIPYSEYALESDVNGKCYMALLSPTVMRNGFGEYTGLNLEELGKLMGVQDLKVKSCATSTINVRGYNRSWGIKIPSVAMYEQGSVFELEFTGKLTLENIRNIMKKGIGVRRNEGFGQVIFLKDYENIRYKLENTYIHKSDFKTDKTKEDENTLRTVALNYARKLINDGMQIRVLDGFNKFKVPNSQVGNILSQLENNRYDGKKAEAVLKKYFEHAIEKRDRENTHGEVKDVEHLKTNVEKIFGSKITELFGIKENIMGFDIAELISEAEEYRLKVRFIIDLIKYENKKGDK